MKKKRPTALVPSSGLYPSDELSRYLQEVHQYPMLTPQEELALFKRYREKGDREAARQLITSHLRLVAKIALEYRSAFQNILDLVQEGNIGLLKAVQNYKPEKGARLGAYAQWWIRSYILKYIIDNFRLIKIGTTKAQKKLFYHLISEKQKLEAQGFHPTHEELAKQLGVAQKDVSEMERRLTQPEYALEAPVGGSEGETSLGDFMASDELPIDEKLSERESQDLLKEKLGEFSAKLNDREQKILQERLLAELPVTLQEIADDYGITKERVRQLESRILEKLKKFLQEGGLNPQDLGMPEA